MHYFETLPLFVMYFFSAIVLGIAFLFSYLLLTPHREMMLIRDGNTAVAIQLVLTFLGFTISLSAVIAHAVNIPDLFLWGLVALVVQVATFWVISHVFRGIAHKLADGCVSSGVFVGGMGLSVGVLQAACMIP